MPERGTKKGLFVGIPISTGGGDIKVIGFNGGGRGNRWILGLTLSSALAGAARAPVFRGRGSGGAGTDAGGGIKIDAKIPAQDIHYSSDIAIGLASARSLRRIRE